MTLTEMVVVEGSYVMRMVDASDGSASLIVVAAVVLLPGTPGTLDRGSE